MSNRERIIEAAVDLMNAEGSAVGTTQLARHLGISPGNLYYHFANREQILDEVLGRVGDELDAVLDIGPDPVTPERLASTLAGGVRVLWRYRFLFCSALELVARDDCLRARYAAFCTRGVDHLDDLLRRARAAHRAPGRLDDATRRLIVENLWVLWASWPRHIEVTTGAEPGERDVLAAHRQLALLLEPYLSRAYYASFTAAVAARLRL